MPLEYIDLKTNKSNARMELEKENESLKEQLNVMDAVVLEILMIVASQGGERIV